ncbi:MAG: trigger factor [Lachnospiraceae bacterium]|nr:trigger factor [Lachnospiraceae bacterium]
MKKRFAMMMTVLGLSIALVACGDKENADTSESETAETAETEDKEYGIENIDPSKYVELGDYEGVAVDVAQAELTDEDVENYMSQELEYYTNTYGLTSYETVSGNAAVKSGDIVNIDYEGKKDGVAFDGGTAQGQHLEIGSGSFIEGFEEGLIGTKPGDTVDLELTFPEEYHAEDLAGQDVVFTVKVNAIEKKTTPEYDDAFFSQVGIEGVTNLDEFKEYYREQMESYMEETNKQAIEDAVWEKVVADAKVTAIPQELLDLYNDTIMGYFENMAAQQGVDLETLVTQSFGVDMASFEADNRDQVEEESRRELIYMAIAQAEGIEITDEVKQEIAKAEYQNYGYADPDEFMNTMGSEDFISYARRSKVSEMLVDKAKVNVSETISFDEMIARENGEG